ncbi:MAG: hypothetical protein FWF81_10640 [Defluviitaleaceae bacterium]|nr:hypothetical protein [Defluviitaleaceae bacterium]
MKKFPLNYIGQFYSAATNEDYPGVFSISVHLNESLCSETLQQAVNDIAKRLPHFNVCKKQSPFWYYNEELPSPPVIKKQADIAEPLRYFKDDDHLLRVIYGERHFTLEISHSVCDGRTLAPVAVSLLIRYYHLLGVEVNNEGFINVNDPTTPEETEDAYVRYADMRKYTTPMPIDVYIPKFEPVTTRTKIHKFNLQKLKVSAKKHGVTVAGYIAAQIFNEFAKQRAKDGSDLPITIHVPIDCRPYYPSKTMQNFVSHIIITMPESVDFTHMARGIKSQFMALTPNYIQNIMSEVQGLVYKADKMPLSAKKQQGIIDVGNRLYGGSSTGLSNLGVITLPKELQERVDVMSFALGPETGLPFLFGCITTGDTVTLTGTATSEDIGIIDGLGQALGTVQK